MPILAGQRLNVGPILGAVLLALCAVFPPALAQSSNPNPVTLTPAQQALVDQLRRSSGTSNVGVIKLPNAAVAEQSTGGGKLVLPLADGKVATLVRTRPRVETEGAFTFRGEVEETGERAVLMLWKDGHLSGYFGYRGRVFMINHMGADIHAMAEMGLPPDHAPAAGGPSPSKPVRPRSPPPEPTVAPFPDAEREALEAKKITIDVMLLYSKNAASLHIGNPADLLALAVEDANETFKNSGLGNINLRLVHTQAIDFDETGADHFQILYAMVDGNGPFTDVKKLRNEKRADIVGLIINNPSGCGLSTRVGADAEDAFFVVHHTCASITISIAHEIAHIIGARHDRAVDANETPVAYAHGYVNGTKWRTMMSYNEGCGGCPRIPYWSNPRIMYKGEPTGTAAADNARVILEQAERVSKFR
jgi:peptidyl-Asp metalloendopeptidase